MARDEIILEEVETEKKKRKSQEDLDRIFAETMRIESDNEASKKEK